MMKRFYCKECRHFLNRFLATYDDYDGVYYCRFCGEPVMRVDKITDAILKDYIKFIIQQDAVEDFE